jgi:hypothetical protein
MPRCSRVRKERDEEAIALLGQAADLEASLDKHPVTPGGIVPVSLSAICCWN